MSVTNRGYFNNSLIMECSPIVHFLFNNHKSKRCDYCVSINTFLKKCSKCRKMYYCDQNCQRNDWKWHKFECDLYHNYYESLNNHSIERILLRLFLVIKSNPDIVNQMYDLPNGKKRCLNDLMNHFDEIQKDNERQIEINAIKKDFENCNIDISTELLTKLFGTLVVNSFGIVVRDSFDGFMHCGSGLYISASILDHSCAPNVYAIANKNSLQIKAKKNIAINEELFISYIDTQLPKSKRQSELKSRYYFDCHCSRCEFEEKDIQVNKNNKNNNFLNCLSEEKKNLLSIKEIEYNPNMTFGLIEDLKLRLSHKNSEDFVGDLNEHISYVKKHIMIAHGQHHFFYQLFTDIVQSNGYNI